MNGIDISMYQKGINFNALDSNIKYCYIKATEGINYKDSCYLEHYNNAKGKVNIGFYHFMSERTNPTQQAQDFYNCIKDLEYQLIPVLDIETNILGRDKTSITDRVIEFLEAFKSITGIDCIIYSYTSFINSYLDERLINYKCWIADYQGNAGKTMYNSYVGHQYTGTGRINAFNGDIDLNNFTEGILLTNPIEANREPVNNNIRYGKVIASVLNVRDNPNGNILGTLKHDEVVKIDKEVDNWYSIYWGNHGGYVSKNYIEILNSIDGVTGTVIASVLNVRDNIQGNIIGTLKKGDKVKLYKYDNGWYHIYYGNNGAWVKSEYINF